MPLSPQALRIYDGKFGRMDKRLVRNYDPNCLTFRVMTFKVIQGRWNRHGSIGHR